MGNEWKDYNFNNFNDLHYSLQHVNNQKLYTKLETKVFTLEND